MPDIEAPIELVPLTPQSSAVFRAGEPITFGIPVPKGALTTPARLCVVDADGRYGDVQSTVLDRWADGSIRWLLVDFQTHCSADERGTAFTLRSVEAGVASPCALRVVEHGTHMEIETGVARFVLKAGAARLLDDVTVSGQSVIDRAADQLLIETPAGKAAVLISRFALEQEGPLHAIVAFEGTVRDDSGALLLNVRGRLHAYAHSPAVRIDLTLHNSAPAGHKGGYWTLGGPGGVYIKDASLEFRLALDAEAQSTHAWWSPEPGHPVESCELPMRLEQRSSRHYRFSAGSRASDGCRATPVAGIEHADGRRLAAAVPAFWQNFPRALEISASAITIRLHSGRDAQELQGGEQKTHTVFVAFGPDGISDVPLDWCRAPLVGRSRPSWYAESGAIPYLTPACEDSNSTYLTLVDTAVAGAHSFERKREVIDEFGWRNFGDIYADHESAFHPANAAPLVSHYNNQYDALAGFAIHFLRTGDLRWWRPLAELARHVVDIDIYHTDGDKASYNGGLFWHTAHYVDAGDSTHRTYPRAKGVPGGGPSAEHNYTTGLMLHYFLTGDADSQRAAVGLADWVVRMDDGRQSIFRWFDRGATGWASSTGSFLYHGPGRAAGNSVVALLNAYRLTGIRAYIDKAEGLIRRCIHPEDDVDARNLADVEQRWSYVVFLQALGRYLDEKADRGEIDVMYSYAKASLLRYARWMRQHEYPYLERPDILEYPTETWAAQDLRKSDVFHFAAKHANGDERAQFLERATFFFRSSTETLARMETRRYTRPVVLMMVNGWMRSFFDRHPDTSAPDGITDLSFPRAESFVPQKLRVKRRLTAAAVVAGSFAFSLLIYLLL
jgi:exo-rhamnogalacturonan lyase-like protein